MDIYFRRDSGVLTRQQINTLGYSDGEAVELRLLQQLKKAHDLSVFSEELLSLITDWPSEYHFSRVRHCLLRPLGIQPGDTVLELGCGCGAMTRYLGEIGAQVDAVEGSLARAEIAAERCRDLPNVTIFQDDLTLFTSEKKYDWVLLIGVLEYAPVYSNAPDPVGNHLKQASGFLAHDGTLVVAIENKLGLKYFNGCSEDHCGKPFYGVQGLYDKKEPVTFGKKELEERLSCAGLPEITFYYPFPDYKLPTVILAEDAFSKPEFRVSELLFRANACDYSGNSFSLFNEALVWQQLEQNGLMEALSNSFLVCASATQTAKPLCCDKLAWSFAIKRRPDYITETCFLAKNEAIRVDKKRLLPGYDRILIGKAETLTFRHVTESVPYVAGQQILGAFFSAWAAGKPMEQCIEYLVPWFRFLWSHAEFYPPENGVSTIRLNAVQINGEYLDCTPFNLLKDHSTLTFIDREWRIEGLISFGFVVTRSILNTLFSIPDIELDNLQETILSAIRHLFRMEGKEVEIHEVDVSAWIHEETIIQHLFSQVPTGASNSHRRNLIRVFKQLNQREENLRRTLEESQATLAMANNEITRRDMEVGQLRRTNEQLNEEKMRIIDEKETALADKASALADKASAITEKNAALAARNISDQRFHIIRNSLSWRLTSPVRRILDGWKLIRDFSIVRKSGLFDSSYYREQNRDIGSSPIPALLHFLLWGAKENRNPNSLFDTRYYTDENPDVKCSGCNPLVHFILHGQQEGRRSHPLVASPKTSGEDCPGNLFKPSSRSILIIDARYPMPDYDSGSVRMMGILNALLRQQYSVTFVSDLSDAPDNYRDALQAKGIYTLTGKEAVLAHLKEYGTTYQAIIASRPDTAIHYLFALKTYSPRALLIYDTVDLHWVRRLRQADIEEEQRYAILSQSDFQKEALMIRRADCILAITTEERNVILKRWPDVRVELLHNIHEPHPLPKTFEERTGLMFIGGFEHAPNVDAMLWFARHILPAIAKDIPSAMLSIVGSKPTPDIQALQSETVNVLGYVPDVDPCFNNARVFVAPIRSGAGMKGKIGQAMCCGLPVVTTTIGAEGMLLEHENNALIADTVEDFANQVVRLYKDQALWNKLRENALHHIRTHFSPKHAEQALNKILSSEGGAKNE